MARGSGSDIVKRCPTEIESLDRRTFQSLAIASLLPLGADVGFAALETFEGIEEGLERLRKRDRLPGLIAGHFTLSGMEDLGAVGFRRAGTSDRLQVDDRMHLGSCTKSMTATLLGMLVDEAKLEFDTQLGDLFRDDPKVTGSAWGDVTLRQLMCHTSGAIPNPPWNQFAGSIDDAVAIRRELLHWMVDRPRRKEGKGKFVYSNLGYAVLGHAIEKIRGHAWEQEISQKLFEPLGMKSAGFGPPSKAVIDSPWGHDVVLGFSVATESDNPPSLGPAGTVHASMQDWIKYLRVHLMGDPSKECGLPLKGETLQQLQQPCQSAGYEGGAEYAGGWGCGYREWAGGRILTHNGSNTHWYCVVFLAPSQKRGVIAASNVGSSAERACDEALQLMIQRRSEFP